MIFLLMAAHDTTAIALSMLAYELGRNTKWQDALREEAVARPIESPTLDDLEDYRMLDAAFKEVLRMYAPAGTLFRQAIRDTEICGHFIPRKSQIAISVHASMRLSDWWPDPRHLRPVPVHRRREPGGGQPVRVRARGVVRTSASASSSPT